MRSYNYNQYYVLRKGRKAACYKLSILVNLVTIARYESIGKFVEGLFLQLFSEKFDHFFFLLILLRIYLSFPIHLNNGSCQYKQVRFLSDTLQT